MELADYSVLKKCIFNDVYEPAEDTFILIDGLEKDLDLIRKKRPKICLEIGSGSGVVITSVGKALGPALYLSTDLNPHAASATRSTSLHNKVSVDIVITDLVQAFGSRLENSVDLIICNPPYAVTPNEEVGGDNLQKATSGGDNGRKIIDKLIPIVPKLLSPNGLFYLTCITENNIMVNLPLMKGMVMPESTWACKFISFTVAPVLYLLLWFLIFLMSGFVLVYVFVMDMPSPKTIYNTIGRDIKAVVLYLKTYSFLKRCHFYNQTFIDFFHENVKKYPDKVCFIFGDEEWTFQQINDFSNKIANYFIQQGYQKGDEVALFMENCPEYVSVWLGLGKIGVITALINTNLRANSLAHSMNVVNIKGLIFGQSLTESLKNALPFIDNKDTAELYCYSRKLDIQQTTPFASISLNVLLEDASEASVDPKKYKANFQDKLMYIYTSGTTGLPKAAIIRHSRFLWISSAAQFVGQLKGPQTIYNPLPMYHTAGGILFLGGTLMFDSKMILRKKFSASNYWKDVVKHKVTVCQYIGEICRYLLNQPKVPEETQHSVWLFFGNGLRPHIWKEFQDRFQIRNIVEMYGATEGIANIVNMFGKVGAVGFVSRIFSKLYPVFLIKVNPETGEFVRDENGFCVRCRPGEPGEIVGKVVKNNPLNSFDGYVNTVDTKKKVLRDCLKKGDMAFLSGDILIMDDDGYLYFLDRTGDTFRWKGENISTGEVENIVSKVLSHSSCVVYGVQIPGTEGRAGMAAIQIDLENVNFEKLYKNIMERLPSYAVPLFIRICIDIEATGTYKLRKVTLQKQGFNPEEISDPIYILDHKNQTYVLFTKELYSDVISGKMKL